MSIVKEPMETIGIKNNFFEKTVIIIGGTSGIGREVAKEFKGRGARTFVAARRLPQHKPFGEFIPCDVRREGDVLDLVGKVITRENKIDILINSMAVNQCKPIEEISLSDWQDVIATNITGIFLSCRAVLPYMKQARSGKIVNISSIAGRHHSPVAGVHYVASKAAIIGFSKQLAYEAAPFGINVNVLCPGQTMTPMLQKGMTQEQIKRLELEIPLRRIANVEDQVGPILFLCSHEASYLSGAVLDVNGGQI